MSTDNVKHDRSTSDSGEVESMKMTALSAPSPISQIGLCQPLKRGLSMLSSATPKRPCLRTSQTSATDDANNISPGDQLSINVPSGNREKENGPSSSGEENSTPGFLSPVKSRFPPLLDPMSTPENNGQLIVDKCTPSSVEALRLEHARLQRSIAAKEQTLNNLKLVRLHRAKNDTETLTSLTSKWRSVVQNAVVELHESIPEPRPTMSDFLDYVRVDRDLIGFDADDESFD